MTTKPVTLAVMIALSSVTTVALACGDKLAMIGGGVSFERIAQTAHPGSVVMLIEPDSPLSRADSDLKLSESLRRTGHSVRRVASTQELESTLRQQSADVVVVYWTEAGNVTSQLGAATSTAPAVVPVVYHATPEQLHDATTQSKCVAEVEKRRGRQLTETVNRAVQQRKSGQPFSCATSATQTST
jgi:hypothetical protein